MQNRSLLLLSATAVALIHCSTPATPMDASDAAVATDTFQPTDIVSLSDVALDVPTTMDADSGSTQDDASREASTTDASDVVALPDVNIIGMCPAAMPVMGAMGVAAPRLIYPLSGSVVSNARPTVQYRLPAGVTGGRVEFCSTRDCDTLLAAFESDSDRVRPNCNLRAGTVYFRVRGKSGGAYSVSTTPVWQLRIPAVIPNVNVADTILRTDADFNGDGLADIATNHTEGAATVLFELIFGSRPGVPQTPRQFASDLGIGGPVVAGDIDGDGYVDMAMKTPGGVTVNFGSGIPAQIITRRVQITEPAMATGFGGPIVPAGDIDGDGYADLLIGAPGAAVGPNNSAGRAFFVRGGPGALTAVSFADGTVSLEQLSIGMSAGDSNGDRIPEVVVGSPFANPGRMGSVGVFQWSAMGSMLVRTITLTLQPESLNQHTGRAVSLLGDNNGDGLADLVASASEFFAGMETVGVVGWKPGTAMGLAGSIMHMAQGVPNATIGARVVQLGDVNGDGYGDIGVAQPAFNAGMGVVGQYRIYQGNAMGLPTELLPSLRGDLAAMTVAGTTIGGIGDFDGDNIDDFVCVIAGPGVNPVGSLRFARGTRMWPPALTVIGNGGFAGVASAN